MRLKLGDIDLALPDPRGNGDAAPGKGGASAIGKLREDLQALVGAVNKAISHMASKIEAKKPVAARTKHVTPA